VFVCVWGGGGCRWAFAAKLAGVDEDGGDTPYSIVTHLLIVL
jgi:hypothetical protein